MVTCIIMCNPSLGIHYLMIHELYNSVGFVANTVQKDLLKIGVRLQNRRDGVMQFKTVPRQGEISLPQLLFQKLKLFLLHYSIRTKVQNVYPNSTSPPKQKFLDETLTGEMISSGTSYFLCMCNRNVHPFLGMRLQSGH